MTDQPVFHALKILETQAPPTWRGMEPFWRAPITPASAIAYVPYWNWHNPTVDASEAAHALNLDANAAYLGAIGSVYVVHGNLNHKGAPQELPDPRRVEPGYYLIATPRWAFDGTIVSPLGDSARLETEDTLWIAHPTLVLLLELLEEGALGDVQILDSYTSGRAVEFRAWSGRLRQTRQMLLARRDAVQTDAARAAVDEQITAFKEGYSMAVSLMQTGERCKTRRPDWAHAIRAQHAATMWRKAWKFTGAGFPLLAMGAVDEITIREQDLTPAITRPKPPFKFDASGRTPGAMKPKPKSEIRPQRAASLPTVDDGEDVL